jgi:hypothetical protein
MTLPAIGENSEKLQPDPQGSLDAKRGFLKESNNRRKWQHCDTSRRHPACLENGHTFL